VTVIGSYESADIYGFIRSGKWYVDSVRLTSALIFPTKEMMGLETRIWSSCKAR
ncbi:4573_t:CDS:1, partial [Paraglomus occultum]